MAKLSGGSTVNGYTIMHTGQSDILMAMIKQFDGTGSGLDADLLDGLHSTSFAQLSLANTFTGNITAPTFIGNVTGTASRATADAAGNIIANTYAPKASPTFTGSVTAPTFIGALTGTATKATRDASGNTISTTYAKLASANTFTGNIKAPTFIGNVTGTATKATGDADGNTISTTYVKKTDTSSIILRAW